MVDQANLNSQRGNIKRQLTVSERFLQTINEQSDLSALNLEIRLQKHLELWDKFDLIQTQLDSTLSTEEDFENPDCERTSFEDRFNSIQGLFRKYINILNGVNSFTLTNPIRPSSDSLQSTNTPEGLGRNSEPLSNPSSSNLFYSGFQLPKLEAPTFNGGFDSWLTFHDTFKSLCHDNPSIPTIHKFHYLKSCLKGDASEVIASIETTSDNYEIAWELLKTRFDNRRYIVECHIEALFKLKNISKETPFRALLDNFQKHVRALKALEVPVEHWDLVLIYIIRDKLNNYNREKWEESIKSTKLPTLSEMISFLERRALIETTQSFHKTDSKQNSQWTKKGSNARSNNQTCLSTTVESKNTNTHKSCPLCSSSHLLSKCDKFIQLSEKERYKVVKNAAICHNCFLSNHKTSECRRNPCQSCHKPHNILLHFTHETPKQSESKEENITNTSTTSLLSYQGKNQSQIVLGTAIVDILDAQGKFRSCRALLDSCSQCNSISEKFANSLGLTKKKTDVTLKGVANLHSEIKFSTSTKIKSRYENHEFNMSFLIFKEISEKMPSLTINRNSIKIPNEIFLVDPLFYEPAEIDILIGAEHFYDMLGAGQIRIKGQTALFQETELGWIFAGRCVSPRASSISCNLIKFKELPILWELGDESSTIPKSEEEKSAELHYTENVSKNVSGSYSVRLPFNDKIDSLGDSINSAYQRFYALEKKFSKDPNLKTEYSDCI